MGAAERVGPFELLARLGRGGQGEVFLARPWAEGRGRLAARLWLQIRLRAGGLGCAEAARWHLAALKLAHPHAAAALHDEHGHLAAPGAGHPHLVALYGARHPGLARDLGPAHRAGGWYLALAYEPGRPLEHALRRRPGPAWSVAAATQVASALAHLHGRGIVHHDVRPANVVVRRGRGGAPHCTLIDLGAAETPAAPRRRAVYGTRGHLPPERARADPAPPSPLVDVYGLGVLLRALTAGAAVSAPLARLIADATAEEGARRAALPCMGAVLARLAALPEAAQLPPTTKQ
jgi:serine/threonine protein kinase